jgi:hypothetical protein
MIRTIALTLTLLVLASSLYAADEKDEHPADGAPRIVITIPDRTPATVRPAALLPMYVGLTGLQAYDGYSTLRGVSRGASEQNPLVGGLSKQPAAFLTLKAVSTLTTIYAAEQLWRQHHKTQAIATLVVANVTMGIVAARNASMLQPR